MSLGEFFSSPLSITFEDIRNITTTIALIVGGIWAYFRFLRGRTFRPRLELTCRGTILSDEEFSYLLVRVKLKNLGLSKTNIKQEGTGIRILKIMPQEIVEAEDATTEHQITLSIFEEHQWIEPNELIEDECLVQLPEQCAFAYEVQVRVVGQGLSWAAHDIVTQSATTQSKGAER